MDLTQLWESIAGRSPMFLAATGSVALGITLIMTAGTVQLKRFRARPRNVVPLEIPLPVMDVEKITANRDIPEKPVENTELRHLLLRLKVASDKLEKSRIAKGPETFHPADSPLKRSPSGVDYIFRAGTG